MPMREFGCPHDGGYVEIFHPAVDPDKVPAPACQECGEPMQIIWSLPNVDTADTFHPIRWRGPTGLWHEINNLHQLRQVEHSYLESGHNVRFDAYSADPSNPDSVDGFGAPHREGLDTDTTGKAFAFMK